ncbi:hypothetical protein GCM10027256_19540 [Novispirillum itersonii subsp. nipponicum]
MRETVAEEGKAPALTPDKKAPPLLLLRGGGQSVRLGSMGVNRSGVARAVRGPDPRRGCAPRRKLCQRNTQNSWSAKSIIDAPPAMMQENSAPVCGSTRCM